MYIPSVLMNCYIHSISNVYPNLIPFEYILKRLSLVRSGIWKIVVSHGEIPPAAFQCQMEWNEIACLPV